MQVTCTKCTYPKININPVSQDFPNNLIYFTRFMYILPCYNLSNLIIDLQRDLIEIKFQEKAFFWYSKIVQSEHTIYRIHCSDWLFTRTPKSSNRKTFYIEYSVLNGCLLALQNDPIRTLYILNTYSCSDWLLFEYE